MKCPHCENKIVHCLPDVIKLRIEGAVTFTGNQAIAKCYWCRKEIQLPIKLDPTITTVQPAFVISQ